ncbi:hypothetical protein VMCG_00694 [Cytospora schulzeri]|uniref:Peroxin 11C n=1 Tax=Cytospora schulzeri TaxID=448051 RepID=A0A423X839_9PEZI|nr:hypothetical protein VMCG_00694 [Valsa malicola]
MTETTSAPETGSTPIGDLPTGEPIPTSSDHKPAAATLPPPHKTTTLPALLKTLPSNADAFLSHLQRCLSTPSGVDTLLLFVCYISRFTGAALTRLSQTLLRRTARELVALVFTLPPKTAIIFGTTSSSIGNGGGKAAARPARTAAARLAALLGQRLASLGNLASETRTIARLWGLVGMYFWARRLTLQLFNGSTTTSSSSEKQEKEKEDSTTTSRLATVVDWAQLVSCAMFQVLENGAYLSGRGVLGWTPAEQGRAYVVGSRWLCVYTGLELGRLLAGLVAAKGGAEGVAATAEEEEEVEGLRRSMAINMAWAPLTLHWATEKGFLSDLAVGAGGCIPGVLQMRKLWRDTA